MAVIVIVKVVKSQNPSRSRSQGRMKRARAAKRSPKVVRKAMEEVTERATEDPGRMAAKNGAITEMVRRRTYFQFWLNLFSKTLTAHRIEIVKSSRFVPAT